jgi:thiamine biosynthesis lipoprotein
MKKKLGLLLVALLTVVSVAACRNTPKENATTESSVSVAKGLREKPYAKEEFLLGTYVRIRVYDEG